jgi:hypothetical protein
MMREATPVSAAEKLDLLRRLLVREADYCDRKARTERVNAERLHRDFNRAVAGYALGYAEANENHARQLRALIVETNGTVKC